MHSITATYGSSFPERKFTGNINSLISYEFHLTVLHVSHLTFELKREVWQATVTEEKAEP